LKQLLFIILRSKIQKFQDLFTISRSLTSVLGFSKKKKTGTLVNIFLFDFKIYPQNIRLKKYDGCIYYNLHFNNIMHKLNYKDELKSADKKIM
jgi:hypothetical protein